MPVNVEVLTEERLVKVDCDECFFSASAPVGFATQRALGAAHFEFHSIVAGTEGAR